MGLEYAENDWILWGGQERSSLAFRYAIVHSLLTTWRLVKTRGVGRGGPGGWKPQSLDQARENIFSSKSLTIKKRKSAIIETYIYIKEPNETWSTTSNGEMLNGAASNGCEWDLPRLTSCISSLRETYGFYRKPATCLLSGRRLAPPARSPVTVMIKSVPRQGTEGPDFLQTFSRPLWWVTRRPCMFSAGQQGLHFPGKSIRLYSNGPDLFLPFFFSFFATRT